MRAASWRTVDIAPADPDALGATLAATCGDALAADGAILLLEATVVGEAVPVERRVVEVLARAERVIAERRGPTGVSRLVLVQGVELVDAGAEVGDDGVLRLPPASPDEAAAAVGNHVGIPVALISRNTPTRTPVILAAHGDIPAGAAGLLLPGLTAVIASGFAAEAGDDEHRPLPTWPPLTWPTDVSARDALGLVPGTPEAMEVGLPAWQGASAGAHAHRDIGENAYRDMDDAEERVARACRLALLPLPQIPSWHPVTRHVQMQVDLGTVRTSVLQLGVRVEAPDDLTLGVAVGRLVVALAAEGFPATPIQHDSSPRSVLIALLGGA